MPERRNAFEHPRVGVIVAVEGLIGLPERPVEHEVVVLSGLPELKPARTLPSTLPLQCVLRERQERYPAPGLLGLRQAQVNARSGSDRGLPDP